jgi:hypothetical protein
MALDSKNNIKSVFIVPSLTAITPGVKITPGSTNSGVAGTVVITNMSNEVLNTTNLVGAGSNLNPALYDKIKIIKDRGADLPLQQLVLTRNQVIAASAVAGKLASEQVSIIGYNGTNGQIAKLDNNFYSVKLEHTPNSFAYGKRPANYKYGTYQSNPTADQAAVANGLQASLVANFRPNRTIDWRVVTEILCNNAGVAVTGTTTTFGVTRYSKRVTINGTITNIVPGDFIRLGGTTVAFPVYKVESVTASNSVVLEVPYQGVTGSIAIASTRVIVAATAATADFGIKITGLKQKYDVNRWRQYDKVRFNVFLDGFTPSNTVTPILTTAAFDGVAVYEQVANDEYISWGDEGQVFVDQVPPLFREQDAVVGTQYSPAVISWLDKLPSLIGAGENKGQAILYLPGASGTADYTLPAGTQLALVTTFNTWSNVDLPATAFPFS